MLLAIDVGNTQTLIGLFEGEDLHKMWRVSTNKFHTADELRVMIHPLFETEGISRTAVDSVALASVVPKLTLSWVEAARLMFDVDALVADAESAAGVFKTDYPNPLEIGSDRVADAVALCALYGAPAIVVDFGTATNIEIIDKNGKFIGGIIAPGIDTSANALFSNATRLAAIDLIDPGHAIGLNTEEAIQIGIVYGEADRVDGLIERVFAELGYRTPVIATGGLASLVAGRSKTISEVNSALTLIGLRIIHEAQS